MRAKPIVSVPWAKTFDVQVVYKLAGCFLFFFLPSISLEDFIG